MTAIHYPDIVAWSPSRNFRCEATSPYNLPDWHPGRSVSPTELVWPGAFQEDFTFALYEGSADQPRWTLQQARVSAVSPHEITVSDTGWCVVRTHGPFSAGLVTISPEGLVGQMLDVGEDLFAGPSSVYVHETSAGPFWAGASHSYFTSIDGREHHCVLTWWGQRVLLDLERGTRSDDAPHSAALGGLELAWAKEMLEQRAAQAASWTGRWLDEDHWLDTDMAAFLAIQAAIAVVSRSHLIKLATLVRPFEACRLLTWSTHCWALASDRKERVSFMLACHGVRELAAFALRRIGARPAGYAAYAVCRTVGDKDVLLELPERIPDRSTRARCLRPGMPGREVLQTIGAPDHLARDWEYDLDDPSQTLQIGWKDAVVERVSLVEPGWLGDRRGHRLFG